MPLVIAGVTPAIVGGTTVWSGMGQTVTLSVLPSASTDEYQIVWVTQADGDFRLVGTLAELDLSWV